MPNCIDEETFRYTRQASKCPDTVVAFRVRFRTFIKSSKLIMLLRSNPKGLYSSLSRVSRTNRSLAANLSLLFCSLSTAAFCILLLFCSVATLRYLGCPPDEIPQLLFVRCYRPNESGERSRNGRFEKPERMTYPHQSTITKFHAASRAFEFCGCRIVRIIVTRRMLFVLVCC